MLRLKPNPTFRAKALIPDPGGPAFDLDCEFKHMGKAEFAATMRATAPACCCTRPSCPACLS